MHYFKQQFLQESKKRVASGGTSQVETLPTAKRGRKLLLGDLVWKTPLMTPLLIWTVTELYHSN